MLNVKVKTKRVRLSIPIPYFVISFGISIISSEFLNRQINKWVKENTNGKEVIFNIPRLDKKELGEILKELRKHKGMELVNVKAKDGTVVIVKP